MSNKWKLKLSWTFEEIFKCFNCDDFSCSPFLTCDDSTIRCCTMAIHRSWPFEVPFLKRSMNICERPMSVSDRFRPLYGQEWLWNVRKRWGTLGGLKRSYCTRQTVWNVCIITFTVRVQYITSQKRKNYRNFNRTTKPYSLYEN